MTLQPVHSFISPSHPCHEPFGLGFSNNRWTLALHYILLDGMAGSRDSYGLKLDGEGTTGSGEGQLRSVPIREEIGRG